ncbi:CHAP domain-containing protein [Candidatus Saccharibacteria bacterium]|nr:CHAP domain-containing protein [Candidatus Saccharibacteria bacterium]
MIGKKNFRRFVCGFLAVVLAILTPASTYALSQSQMKTYSDWNIFFYDPEGGRGGSGGCSSLADGENVNYAGATVFSSVELEAIKANKPFYEKAAEQYGFPWQILAVIHKRENSLTRRNPNNGQGAYQLYSYTHTNKKLNSNAFLPAGPIDDAEFQRQTDIAAQIVNDLGAGVDLNTDVGVKRLFFKYNGAANVYVKQALNLGFSQEEADSGEGSPYVMNRFDERRDPTIEPTSSNNTWGQIKKDNGPMEYPANTDFGAFVMYVALGGSSAYCGGVLKSGGMNLGEAREFMSYYREQAVANKDRRKVVFEGMTYENDCSGGALANCVSFSKWFLNKYVSGGPYAGLGNGRDVVGGLINRKNSGFENGNHTPRAYAIFSRRSGGVVDGVSYGHTGVVLGVDMARKKIVIGEASCGASPSTIDAKEEDLEKWTSDDYSYAYTDLILKGL